MISLEHAQIDHMPDYRKPRPNVRADKDIVLDAQAVPQLNTTLDGDAVSDDDIVLNQAVRIDIAVGPDTRTCQHDTVLPYRRASPKPLGLHIRARVNRGRGLHSSLLNRVNHGESRNFGCRFH